MSLKNPFYVGFYFLCTDLKQQKTWSI